MRKPANIFLLAIIVGALSAAMIYRHLKSMNLEVEAAKAAGQHPVTDVVVARDTISIGTRVTPGNVFVPGRVVCPRPGFGHCAVSHRTEGARFAYCALVNVDNESGQHDQSGEVMNYITDSDQ